METMQTVPGNFDDLFPLGEQWEEEEAAPADNEVETEEEEEQPEPDEAEEDEPEDVDTPDEAEDSGDPEDTEQGEEKADEPKTWKVAVDGAEREVDEEELVRGYATNAASAKRFQEAKALHDEAKAFYSSFLESPGDALTDLVANKIGDRSKARERVRDVFLEWLAPDLEESLIEDEREKELYRRRREIEDAQKDLDRRQSETERKAQKEADEAFVAELERSISAGLKRHDLPDRDEIWARAGQLVDAALKVGTKKENIQELVPGIMKQVAEEREAQARELVGTLTPEELYKMFPDVAEALKKVKIEQVRNKRSEKKTGASKKAKGNNRKPKWTSTRDL